MIKDLNLIYEKLFASFGPQGWWPAETPFEVIVGAILTQNTNWLNVEKAIANLKQHDLLTPKKLYALPLKKLSLLIKPAGYYNIKAARLREFLKFLFSDYQGSLKKMASLDTADLRRQLLSIKGIGPETADSILLYAFKKPIFVIDAYTRRMLERHKLVKEKAVYDNLQKLFMKNLIRGERLFNQYHALLVRLAKEFCVKNNPRCQLCPIK